MDSAMIRIGNITTWTIGLRWKGFKFSSVGWWFEVYGGSFDNNRGTRIYEI